MKVLLVQLPVPDNRFSNLPLALGYLKAMTDAANLPGVRVELLEAESQNRGGDAFLVDTILAHSPDLVGFSLYTWNSSRTLGLARALKRLAPEIIVVGGGPEVNHDGDFILASTDFDFLVLGEGERTFVELLQTLNQGQAAISGIRGLGYRTAKMSAAGDMSPQASHNSYKMLPISKQWHFNPAQPALEDVNLVPSAYLSGALESHLGRYMSIELSRWCPSKCSFCYYGRQDLPRGGKRYFEIERVRQELLFGLERGVEQVHFVEANFNTLPHLPRLYETIRETEANRKMSFYAELRGEAIDQAEAERLAQCNFGTVEVGLQSAVPEVLARVQRKNHLPRLVQGVHNLRSQGIEVFLDVILGLPGETTETFQRTLAFVEDNDLAPYDLFQLQMLPGTQLKAEAEAGQHGMRWQVAPPYFVLETADLSFETLGQLRRETLSRKGDDPTAVPGMPQPGPFALAFGEAEGVEATEATGPVERVLLDLTERLKIRSDSSFIDALARRLGSQVTLWLTLGQAGKAVLDEAETVLQKLSEPNPSGVWQLFVETDQPLSQSEQIRLCDAIYHEEDYLDRVAVFAQTERTANRVSRWPSLNFFQLLPFQTDLLEEATTTTVWKVILEESESAEQWKGQLAPALQTQGIGLQVVTPLGCSPAKLQATLEGLELGQKRLWLTDWRLAAGLAYASAEDSTETLTGLDYPLTVRLHFNVRQYERLRPASLERAALRWALVGAEL